MDIKSQISAAVTELVDIAKLEKGDIFVVGCSTSEVVGSKIGTNSDPDTASELFDGIMSVLSARGIYLAVQCCEHLNRAIVVEKAAVPFAEYVNAVPQKKAGGSLATVAYNSFNDPCVVEEIKADAPVEECCPEVEEVVDRTPDPVQPVKEQIEIDDFAKLDFRVCEVLKAESVRKSHSCLKLTLNDGLGERVIMSSIKEEYTPEMLIGKKIIVIANLKPNRICNVNSQGMLLAATNNACGCKVIFVDDSVPAGTRIG